ncbi:MAG: hypothetical protein JW841_03415 [Deltaproteobacteria bacterium]|nr:hypothetical protein [Deltaproteobacteria bacterium]
MAIPSGDFTKGSVIRRIFEFIEQSFGHQAKKQLDNFAAEINLSSNMVTTSSWFPTSDYFKLLDITVELFSNGQAKQLCINLGKYALEKDLKGIYRAFVRILSPQAVLSKGGRIWRQYHSEGEWLANEIKQNSCKITLLRNKNSNLHEWYVALGGTVATIGIAGGKNVQYKVIKGDMPESSCFEFNCVWQ